MTSYTYIMTNKKVGTFYIGVTSDLARRIWEHKNDIDQDSFTARYQLHKLIWYQPFDDIKEAIRYEKRLKKWPRQWKVKIIEKLNPDWDDLFNTLNQ